MLAVFVDNVRQDMHASDGWLAMIMILSNIPGGWSVLDTTI